MKFFRRADAIFGVLAFALMFFVITSNVEIGSITGMVVGSNYEITLVAPSDNTQTQYKDIYFMFKYPDNYVMQSCSLLLNGESVKTANTLLFSYDTRIKFYLEEGSYEWNIMCTDTENKIISSETRKLVIGTKDVQEVKISGFRGRSGSIYEFEIEENMELKLEGIIPNDALRATKGSSSYDVNIIRISEDYNAGTEYVDLLIDPGNKRIKIYKDSSEFIDFNNDGEYDIEIYLTDVIYRKASFLIYTQQTAVEEPEEPVINNQLSSVASPETPSKPQEQSPGTIQYIKRTEKTPSFWEFFLVVIIIVVIIAFVSIKKKKNTQEDEEESVILIHTKSKKAVKTAKKRKPARPARKNPKKKVVVKKKATKKSPVKKKKAIVKKKVAKKKTAKKKVTKKKIVRKKTAKKKTMKKKKVANIGNRKIAKKKTVKRKSVNKKLKKKVAKKKRRR